MRYVLALCVMCYALRYALYAMRYAMRYAMHWRIVVHCF